MKMPKKKLSNQFRIKLIYVYSLFVVLFSSTLYPSTFYVDSQDGDDSNDGLSPANAWLTIEKVNSIRLSPGDTILFSRGSTWYGELRIDNSGTEENPIVFTAYGTGNKPKIIGLGYESCITIGKADYIIVDTFELQNGDYGLEFGHRGSSNHLVIKNIDAHGADEMGFFFNGEIGEESTDFVVENCTAFRNSIHGFRIGNDRTGSIPTVSHLTFINCVAYDNGYHGIQISDGSANIEVIGCQTYNNAYHGIRFGDTKTGLAKNCISYRNEHSGISVASTYVAPDNITIEGCKLYENTNHGISIGNRLAGPVKIKIMRNQIYSNAKNGIKNSWNSRDLDIRIHYNLIYNNTDDGISLEGINGGGSAIFNNSIVNNNGTGVKISNNSNFSTSFFNNILYLNSEQMRKQNEVQSDYNLYFPGINSSDMGSNDLAVDPLFKDTDKHDFQLQPQSPAINAGTNVGLLLDFMGISVPQGEASDIGAFEYSEIFPPRNLKLIKD